MLRRVLAGRPGRLAIVLLLLTAAWQLWLAVQAAPKIPRDLGAHASVRGTVDVRVGLRFPPERFHILTFQRFGRVSGTEDDAVDVRSVPIGKIWQIARFYWVKTITILPEGARPTTP